MYKKKDLTYLYCEMIITVGLGSIHHLINRENKGKKPHTLLSRNETSEDLLS